VEICVGAPRHTSPRRHHRARIAHRASRPWALDTRVVMAMAMTMATAATAATARARGDGRAPQDALAKKSRTSLGRRCTVARAASSANNAKGKLERIDGLLSRCGYCARSEVKGFLRAHEVVALEAPVTSASAKARAEDVCIDGQPLDNPNGVLVVMNKPSGLVCSHDAREGANVYALLPERWRARKPSVETVGRLDKDTTGLLLFTDVGALNHTLTSPKKDIGKWYRVRVDKEIPQACVEVFASGTLTLEGETKACKPARCEILGPYEARLELTEGKYHQVKRMFAFFDCTVIELHRESFGVLNLGSLKPGEYTTLPLDFDFAV